MSFNDFINKIKPFDTFYKGFIHKKIETKI
jgi:hypothetical protein